MNARLKRACVIGWPIVHSRSPLIHRHWLDHYAIEGRYEAIAVEPGMVDCFITKMRRGDFIGCNVTIPHKQAVLDLVDEIDPLAARLGAANTIHVAGGRLKASNTDGYGFRAQLDACVPGFQLEGAVVTVLGAGGAARAVVGAVLDAGAGTVRVVNRTAARARDLAATFDHRPEITGWGNWPEAFDRCSLLVNSTALGMVGQPALGVPLDHLPAEAVVYDIVYAPLRTGLLADAEARGHPVVDGLGMLLHQAVPGFALWFGVRPEVTAELHAKIAADVEANS